MTVKELRKMAKALGIKTTGLKRAEMIKGDSENRGKFLLLRHGN